VSKTEKVGLIIIINIICLTTKHLVLTTEYLKRFNFNITGPLNMSEYESFGGGRLKLKNDSGIKK